MALTDMKPINLGVTIGGKQIQLAKVKRGNKVVRVIQFVGGGQIPQELEGIFTDTRMAQVAANNYIARIEKETAKAEEAAKRRTKGKATAATAEPEVKE